jgi:hypothetical protein
VSLDAERVRRAALDALEPFGDARALHILDTAAIELEDAGPGWEGTGGALSAWRVILLTDGASLARFQRIPAVADALVAALAGAVAALPGHALVDVCAYWGERPPRAAAYRTTETRAASADDALQIREAAVAYLRESGDDAAAAQLSSAGVTLERRAGLRIVRIAIGHRASKAERRAIAAALAAVLAQPHEDDARLEWP